MQRKLQFLRTIIWILIVLLICNQQQTARAERAKFKIGVIQSLTGMAEEDGQNIVRALRLAQEKINRRNPNTVELIIEDDATNPKNTVSAYRKLASQGVDALLAATWVHTTESLAPLARSKELVTISTSNFPEVLSLNRGGGYLYTTGYSLAEDVKTFERYITENKVKRIVFIRNSSSWSQIQVEYYRKVSEKHGVSVLKIHEAGKIEGNNWQAVLPGIKAINPDLLVFFLGKDDVEVLLRRISEIKLNIPLFGANHTYDAFKRSKHRDLYQGLCFTYPYQQLQRNPGFLAEFRARYNEEAQLYADSSYDALMILVKALQLAGKEKKTAQILQNEEFNGLVGNYRFSEEFSLSNGSTSLLCIKNGRLVGSQPDS